MDWAAATSVKPNHIAPRPLHKPQNDRWTRRACRRRRCARSRCSRCSARATTSSSERAAPSVEPPVFFAAAACKQHTSYLSLTHTHSPTLTQNNNSKHKLQTKKAADRRARRGERQGVPLPRLRVPLDRPQALDGPQRQGARVPAVYADRQVDDVPADQGPRALPQARRDAPRPQAAEPAGARVCWAGWLLLLLLLDGRCCYWAGCFAWARLLCFGRLLLVDGRRQPPKPPPPHIAAAVRLPSP